MTAVAAFLPDGRRLHLQHGPIDLIIDVTGPGRSAALGRAARRFAPLLDDLVAELPRLRSADGPPPSGTVARRMAAAVAPYAPAFITPMAAVAGAVADEVLAAILDGPGLTRAHVNNGGDIALWLAPGENLTVLAATDPPARLVLGAGDGIGGIATSGWRGRSLSLGIADSATALAASAAAADAAATMIANAVDLPGHPGVTRVPARARAPDSDLGDRPVTVAVAPLAPGDRDAALDRGAALAADLCARGLIRGAALTLAGALRTAGIAAPANLLPAP